MTTRLEIINPDDFEKVFIPNFAGINMVQCNKNKDVSKFIKVGKKYVIELPSIKTILNVECTYVALAAADMRIKSAFVNNTRSSVDEDYTISYQYEHFDSMHYSSFAYREKCIVYISFNDLF
jgi:hypothetical protein